MKHLLWLAIVLTIFTSCKDKKTIVEPAFYYWKSSSSGLNSQNLLKTDARKIYLKYFEVDYSPNMGNYPLDKTETSEYDLREVNDSIEFVPTIYIKNQIFPNNNNKSLDLLADNIVFLVNKYNKEKGFKKVASEIQIDCDWTKSTKDSYFYLLKKIKELSKKQISCTLRLYPYKYPDIMGVPPVDKVTLMCYNLIKPFDNKNKNSIFDLEEFKKYLDKKREYPIHLDIALPVFYWSQLYQNNHFVELIDFNKTEVEKIAKKVKPYWYEVTKDTSFGYYEDNFLRKGDQIKCEYVTSKELTEAIEIIKNKVVLDEKTTVILFDLDDKTFKQFSHEEISSFYHSFSK